MNVQTAMFGREGEVRGSGPQGRHVGVYFGDGGGVVRENSGYELERVCVPVVGHARSFELVVGKMASGSAGSGGGGLVGQSLRQVHFVHTYEAPFVREVPMGEVGGAFVGAEGVVDFDAVREEGLGYVEDFAAVGPVAVF